jgi:hypothetical protein
MCHDIDPLESIPVYQVFLQHRPSSLIASPSFLNLSGPLNPIYSDFGGSLMADNYTHQYNPRMSLAVHHLLMARG